MRREKFNVLLCDDQPHTRRLVADVLVSAGFDRMHFARDGSELLQMTVDLQPRIVVTSSRVPNLSGLEYTRLIRDGYESVNRSISIIVMTNTPTQTFMAAARESGVDEMLARPFTGAALLSRVEAVLLRPRRFIESVEYVGPCRRRRMIEDYGGPLRRFSDPFENENAPPWEAESNRDLVKICVTRLSELAVGLNPRDRRMLRDIYAAVQDTEQLADDTRDVCLGAAARSLGRYITAVGATGLLDTDAVITHIEAMQKLSVLTSIDNDKRDLLVEGLTRVVDKRLGAAQARAANRRAV